MLCANLLTAPSNRSLDARPCRLANTPLFLRFGCGPGLAVVDETPNLSARLQGLSRTRGDRMSTHTLAGLPMIVLSVPLHSRGSATTFRLAGAERGHRR
jgi:hypothetical protein